MKKRTFGKLALMGLRLGVASLASAGVFLHSTPATARDCVMLAATDDAHTTVSVWGTSGGVATVTVGSTVTTHTGTTGGGGGGGSDPNGNTDTPNPCETAAIDAGSAGTSNLPPRSFSDAQAMVIARGGVHTTRDANKPTGSVDAAIPHTNPATGDLRMPFDPMLNGPSVFTTPQAGMFNTGGYGQTWLGLVFSAGFNVAGPPPMSEQDARELIYFHELYHIMNPSVNHPSVADGSSNLRILAAFDAYGNITSTDGGALALFAASKNPGNPAGFQQTLLAAGVSPAKAMAVTARVATPCNTGS